MCSPGSTAHKAGFGHFIDGKFTDPAAGKSFKVTNPADGKLLARVADGTAERHRPRRRGRYASLRELVEALRPRAGEISLRDRAKYPEARPLPRRA